jgi:diphosphomevalonate decarboxylase
MTQSATAIAHANIALSKYWGKQDGEGNHPAVPSLSVTLEGLATTTVITLEPELTSDQLELNGIAEEGSARDRAAGLLGLVRSKVGRREFARVVSHNNFPTASGLASSASGFAAMALAAVRAYALDVDLAQISELARTASGSSARSLFGGFVELPMNAPASCVAPPEHLPLELLVCVTTEAAKETSSRAGMNLTKEQSPYYAEWLRSAPRIHEELKRAVLKADLAAVGELAERSALAMHASAFAAGVIYFSGATIAAFQELQALRRKGHALWATADAGPHLKVIVAPKDAAHAANLFAQVPGVLRVIRTRPGKGAYLP